MEIRYDIKELPERIEEFMDELEKDPSLVIIFTKDSKDELVLISEQMSNMLGMQSDPEGSALDDGSFMIS